MMARFRKSQSSSLTYVTGDRAIDAQLKAFEMRTYSIVRPGLSKALTVLARAIRRNAPVGETRNLKKAIGKRLARSQRQGQTTITAKVGVNVGLRPSAGKPGGKQQAPHAHLVALGTGERRRKSGGSTGTMPANPFVKTAISGATASARAALLEGIRKALARVLAKKGRR